MVTSTKRVLHDLKWLRALFVVRLWYLQSLPPHHSTICTHLHMAVDASPWGIGRILHQGGAPARWFADPIPATAQADPCQKGSTRLPFHAACFRTRRPGRYPSPARTPRRSPSLPPRRSTRSQLRATHHATRTLSTPQAFPSEHVRRCHQYRNRQRLHLPKTLCVPIFHNKSTPTAHTFASSSKPTSAIAQVARTHTAARIACNQTTASPHAQTLTRTATP